MWSRHVARCRQVWPSPALMVANSGSVSPEHCHCWLPVRLPDAAVCSNQDRHHGVAEQRHACVSSSPLARYQRRFRVSPMSATLKLAW